jgi:hypothetical protein
MMSWMIGSHIGMIIFAFSLKMKAGDPQHVTLAIKVNQPIVVYNALDIHSSVRTACLLLMHIHRFTSSSDGMDSFSNALDLWILVLCFTLVMRVYPALQTNTTKFHVMSFVLCIPSESHSTSSSHVNALLPHPSTFNFCRWTFSLPPEKDLRLPLLSLCLTYITWNPWREKSLQAVSTVNCADSQIANSQIQFKYVIQHLYCTPVLHTVCDLTIVSYHRIDTGNSCGFPDNTEI